MTAKTPPTLSEIAHKKRQLYLVEKLHAGKALTPQEIKELEQFEGKESSQGFAKSEEETARHFGVTYRSVQRWKKDGMPVRKDGQYDLAAITKWRSQHSVKGCVWAARIRQYRAELLELDLKKAKGELISRDEVEKDMIAKILAVKQALLGLPSKLAPLIAMKPPREIAPIIYEAVCEILDTFSGTRDQYEQWAYGEHRLD